MPDRYQNHHIDFGSPFIGGFAVTPADGSDLPQVTRQIRITGTAGNVAVVWYDGTETVEPVTANAVLDWRVTRIKSTGTTATGIRGYY
jgi:hypothetical protein